MKIYPIKEVREREYDERVAEFAHKRADMAQVRLNAQQAKINRLLNQGINDAHTIEQKWYVMDQIMDIVNAAVGPFTPCKAGCDACCHSVLPVSILEAERIALHTGRALAKPPLEADPMGHKDAWTPCPFLKKGRCSIYAVRPLCCKWHFNMDSVNTLCSPASDGKPVRIMFWNRVPFETAAYQILGPAIRHECADIRDFFPQE